MGKKSAVQQITYGEVTQHLLDILPEIGEAFAEEVSEWEPEPIPPDIVYGSIFSGFLRKVMTEDNRTSGFSRSDVIRRSFELIERLAQSEDFNVRCIAEVSILESLLGQDKGDWRRSSPYFEKDTLQMARRVAENMGLAVGN